MRRRRSELAGTSVSLFPFLAVLICTMGVLIVLLVVASKAAEVHRQDATGVLSRQLSQQLDELDFEKQEQDLMLDVLLRSRSKLQEQLSQARLRRSHVDEELRKLEQDFAQTAGRARQLSESSDEPQITDAELKQLEQRIAENEATLELAAQERQKHSTSYAIVAHPSLNGTQRRPIYVECTEDAIILQPSGVVIQTSELLPPVLPGNPLDAALLAIREYWTKFDLVGEHGEPYPLLIVRPAGAQSYALARRAMQSWNDEFGYELIEQFKSLNYGEADQRLVAALESTLQTARAQYGGLRRLAQQTEQGQLEPSDEGLRASRDGGFETISGSTVSPREETEKKAVAKASLTEDSSDGEFTESKPLEGAGKAGGTVAPLAQKRGENWALPAHQTGATAYRRPIVVSCDSTALSIDGGTNSENRVRIPWADDEASVDEFVSSIWKVIQSWGIAERNGYWQPELRVVVEPGGQATFERVQMLLEGSGFDVMRAQFR